MRRSEGRPNLTDLLQIKDYYQTEGADDQVVIDFVAVATDERYVPRFRFKAGLNCLPPTRESVLAVMPRATPRFYSVTIEGTFPSLECILEIEPALREASHDLTFTIKFAHPGSLQIVFECRPEGFAVLQQQFNSGQLKEIAGFPILNFDRYEGGWMVPMDPRRQVCLSPYINTEERPTIYVIQFVDQHAPETRATLDVTVIYEEELARMENPRTAYTQIAIGEQIDEIDASHAASVRMEFKVHYPPSHLDSTWLIEVEIFYILKDYDNWAIIVVLGIGSDYFPAKHCRTTEGADVTTETRKSH